MRRVSEKIMIGSVAVGGNAPVSVQSMAKADPHDAAVILQQIERVRLAGCDIMRLAVPDVQSVAVFAQVRQASSLPLIADIHFDYKLAIGVLQAGADGLRINPGNIGGADKVREVVAVAQERMVPIRIGVNGGSLERDILAKYGSATPEALVESALRHVALLETAGYGAIKISVKASDVLRTVAAYRLLAERVTYPLHLGVTEAGTSLPGSVRSSVALGALLLDGIGDTIRVSLTDIPEQEVRVGVEILRSMGLRSPGAAVTSCPTCGRCEVDVVAIAQEIEAQLESFYALNPNAPRPHVAVMGCMVNGPGEAREADIAVSGGKGKFALYERGNLIRSVPENQVVESVLCLVKAAGCGS